MIEIYKKGNKKIEKEKIKINKEYLSLNVDNKKYKHYMFKEILEEPVTTFRLINSLKFDQKEKLNNLLEDIENSKKVVFLGSGSSYNASLFGSYLLRKLGYDTFAIPAGDFEYFNYDKDTLLVAISQSGETKDVIYAVNKLKDKVKKVYGLVNVPYSTLHRIVNESIELKAGFEIAVAATKTFINQIVFFLYLAKKLGLNLDIDSIPLKLRDFLDEKNIEKINNWSKNFINDDKLIIIGKGLNYIVAREIALKLKEITYTFTLFLRARELKHGYLALIDDKIKVLAIDYDIETNIKEIESRHGKVYRFSTFIKEKNEYYFSLLSITLGQLLSYFLGYHRNLPIDKPRNLAKVVTVL